MKSKLFPVLISLLLASCSTGSAPQPDVPVVSVSILPQRYLVEQLAGDLVEVNVLVPPGASPASYEPMLSQMAYLEESSLYLKAGYLGFELNWMDRIIHRNPEMKVIDQSEGLSMIGADHDHEEHHHHKHSGTDPHIWMSVRNMKSMASLTGNALAELLPKDSVEIMQKLEKFHLKCDSLDREISAMLDDLEKRTFLIYHPALGYFARDYHLEQLALEFEGKTPSPATTREVADKGKELGIRTIFIQKQFNREHADVLAREIGATVVQIDPLDPDWAGQIMHLAGILKEGGRQ